MPMTIFVQVYSTTKSPPGALQRRSRGSSVALGSPEMAYRLECWCSRSRRLLWLLPRKLAGSVSEMCLRAGRTWQTWLLQSTRCCSCQLAPARRLQSGQAANISFNIASKTVYQLLTVSPSSPWGPGSANNQGLQQCPSVPCRALSPSQAEPAPTNSQHGPAPLP